LFEATLLGRAQGARNRLGQTGEYEGRDEQRNGCLDERETAIVVVDPAHAHSIGGTRAKVKEMRVLLRVVPG
jgi:hypothetical protein